MALGFIWGRFVKKKKQRPEISCFCSVKWTPVGFTPVENLTRLIFCVMQQSVDVAASGRGLTFSGFSSELPGDVILDVLYGELGKADFCVQLPRRVEEGD
jgi:hypothetical protein